MSAIPTIALILIAGQAVHAHWGSLAIAPANLPFPMVVAITGDIHAIGCGSTWGAAGPHSL